MGTFDEMLDYLRNQRRRLLSDLHDLESGLRRHSEKREGEWVDVTQEAIGAWTEETEQIEKLIEAYERRNAS
jgi:CTP-dependent riboflavin kinase